MSRLLAEMPLPSERPNWPPGNSPGAPGPAAANRDQNLSENDKVRILQNILKLNYLERPTTKK